VVIIAVYVVLTARLAEGVKVATLSVASSVTAPLIPGERVKVSVLIVVGFMASLNVAVATELRHAPNAFARGVIAITVGGPATWPPLQVLVPVVKVHE